MLETGSEQERELRGGLQGGKLEMESRWGRERKETRVCPLFAREGTTSPERMHVLQ
jgi:hypothetical protein